MKVAKVFLNKYNSGKLLGFADIMFRLRDDGDGCITIKGFKLFSGDDGISIALPSRKDDKGDYYPLVNINLENEDGRALSDHIKEEIMKVYNNSDKNSESKKETSKKSTNTQQKNNSIGDDDIPF
jgi:DNA-binding cell septation regulator SpoVG